MKLKKSVRHTIAYAGVVISLAFFRAIPRRVGISLGRLLALVFYSVSRFHRENTIRHLTMALGDEKSKKEIRRLSRQVFLHFATAGVDAIRLPIHIKKGIDRYITTKNLHYLEAAHQSPKGYLLMTAHFGNWELMGAWIGQKGYQPHAVGAALSNPKLNKLMVKTRNEAGYVNIERGNATKGVIQALKDGFPVGLLIDQDTRTKGVFVDFFGMKAHTPVGPAVLAGLLDVPIITVAMHIKKDLTYEMESFEPLYYIDTGNREKDIITLTQKCSDVCEQIIRQHPEQWVWMHRRWKKQPGDKLKKKLLFSDTSQRSFQQQGSIRSQSHSA
jgi:KDO2-lipid IV(A) lauroyltransferase